MILLTGSSGYIGSHISHILEKNKIKYIGIDNLSKSSINNIVNKKGCSWEKINAFILINCRM